MPDYRGTPCKQCGEIIDAYSLSGYCRACWHKNRGVGISKVQSIEDTIERHKQNLNVYHFVRINGIQIPEHRFIWERESGKKLPRNWIVHHLNGLKGDNRSENLVAMPKGDHDSKALVNALKNRIRELERGL